MSQLENGCLCMFSKIMLTVGLVIGIGLCTTCHAKPGWIFGGGHGQEYEETYQNSAVLIGFPGWDLVKANPKLFFGIQPYYSFWHAHAAAHTQNHIVWLNLEGKAYFFEPSTASMSPYLLVQFGPSWLSNKLFGQRHLGAHWALATTVNVGVEVPATKQWRWDVRLGLLHICNAGLAKPNKAFNLPLVLQIGMVL